MPVARGSRSAPVLRHVRESEFTLSRFTAALAERNPDPSGRRWLYAPYDQLSDRIGPLGAGRPAPSGDHSDREPGGGGAPSLPQAEARARPRQPATVRARTGGTGSRRAPCRRARRIRRRAGVSRKGGGGHPGHAAGRTRAARRASPPSSVPALWRSCRTRDGSRPGSSSPAARPTDLRGAWTPSIDWHGARAAC